jgi:hypothetical protein
MSCDDFGNWRLYWIRSRALGMDTLGHGFVVFRILFNHSVDFNSYDIGLDCPLKCITQALQLHWRWAGIGLYSISLKRSSEGTIGHSMNNKKLFTPFELLRIANLRVTSRRTSPGDH